MFIPTWLFSILFWVILGIIAGIAGIKIGKPKSDFDFFSPLFGAAIVIMYIIFLIGYLIGKFI